MSSVLKAVVGVLLILTCVALLAGGICYLVASHN